MHYLQTAESQDNILPRGGPIQNPLPPLLEVVSPHYKSYTAKRLYNYVAIIQQRKMYNIYRQRLQCKYHSSMYSSKAVGRRRIRTGRPEPEAD